MTSNLRQHRINSHFSTAKHANQVPQTPSTIQLAQALEKPSNQRKKAVSDAFPQVDTAASTKKRASKDLKLAVPEPEPEQRKRKESKPSRKQSKSPRPKASTKKQSKSPVLSKKRRFNGKSHAYETLIEFWFRNNGLKGQVELRGNHSPKRKETAHDRRLQRPSLHGSSPTPSKEFSPTKAHTVQTTATPAKSRGISCPHAKCFK